MKLWILRMLAAMTLFVTASLLVVGFAAVGVGPAARPLYSALAAPSAQEATPEVPPREPPLPPTVNFTRADYQAALAKWRSQAATEYEIVLSLRAFSHLGGNWRLTVQSNAAVERVIAFERLGTAGDPVSGPEEFNELTVAGIFNQIDHGLQEVEKAAGVGSFNLTPYVYSATFHPTLGYPVSYGGVPAQPAPDAEFAIDVRSVTILRRSTLPGIPRTGNPGP